MRRSIVTLLAFGCCVASVAASCAAAAEIPPLVYCYVEPWDSMIESRVIGIPSHIDGVHSPAFEADITITLLNDNYQPLPGLFVEILIDWSCVQGGGPVCICEDAELTGYSDDQGQLQLNLAFGGCCDAQHGLEIRANGVTARVEERLVSPDWDGQRGDCQVHLADFVGFANGYEVGAPGCSDFTGDGITGLGDFVIFAAGWMRDCTPR